MDSLRKKFQWRAKVLLALALAMGLTLAGCGRLPSPLAWLRGERGDDATTSPLSPLDDPTAGLTLTVDPPGGSGGLYIRVRGEQWPRNMMALVALEDGTGRSDTLAAVDTDPTGQLATGFVFPIDERWIESDSTWVVVTTADGEVEAKTRFTVVPPGSEVPANASRETVVGSGRGQVTAGTGLTATGTLSHALTLPLVLHSEVRAADAGRGDARQVAIAVQPGRASPTIRCDDPNAWITLAILSAEDFDAADVVPGSVAVVNGSNPAVTDASMRVPDQGDVIPAAYSPTQADDRLASNLANFTWRWSLDDVDRDGRPDMVMEFLLDSTDLTCEANAVRVTGRTKDGSSFEGRAAVEAEETLPDDEPQTPRDDDDDDKDDKKSDKDDKPGRGRGRRG